MGRGVVRQTMKSMRIQSARATAGCWIVLIGGILASPTVGQERGQMPTGPLVPDSVALSQVARNAINAPWLTDEERRDLRMFHGVWDERDLDTPEALAVVALNAWDFDDPAFGDESVPVEVRAEAMLRRGELEAAIALLESTTSARAARIRAEAHEALGDQAAAEQAASRIVRRLLEDTIDDPAELTESVRAMTIRARIQGQPSRDYKTMMKILGRAHQELDRLYWPAKLAEAELLLDKDNTPQAIAALHEVLALNPRCADAWFNLGRVAVSSFDFDSAHLAADALRRLDAGHPLADLLLAEAALMQDDPDAAVGLLEPLLEREPKLRPAVALRAAAAALFYDAAAARAALDRYEQLSPGSAAAYYVVGRHLAFNRQYGAAARMLQEAIRRQPAWPAPQIELGLMELQSGRDAEALDVLGAVVALDPFNKRAINSLFLLEELSEYTQIESEHFVVRYQPGIDEVMAQLMLEPLERIHATVTKRFGHEPDRKTVIELMPDHGRFAVRITGMPWIHTVAASTGPVIALEVPREGPPNKHLGTFDWPRVIQHEYTHTITLSQTRNRIPHWLTEAAAVSMEPGPRDYDRCVLLAEAYQNDRLFDLDEIKWAFVRPRRADDRALAYAQSHWMVEYMNLRFGESALVRLLGRYFEGEREEQALPGALGISREQFFEEFLDWAGQQVEAWGLAPQPSLLELTDELRWADPQLAEAMRASQQARLDVIVKVMTGQIGEPARGRRQGLRANQWPPLIRPPITEISDETVADWLEKYPEHPDVLELHLRRQIQQRGGADETHVALLERYARLRPVDDFPHRKLTEIWRSSETPLKAIPHLEALDSLEEKSPAFALELAKLYYKAGDTDEALANVTRAVHLDPYHAPTREVAAPIAILADRLDLARKHIVALTLIEPDRAQHRKRLAAIDRRIAEGGGGG
jgi:tetratricopeptide (TPR) repeat protein